MAVTDAERIRSAWRTTLEISCIEDGVDVYLGLYLNCCDIQTQYSDWTDAQINRMGIHIEDIANLPDIYFVPYIETNKQTNKKKTKKKIQVL